MKKTQLLTTLFLAILIAFPVYANSAENEGNAGVDILSNYVWRGIKLSDDNGVLEPSVGITSGSFSVNLWANYDLDTKEANETDLTLSYARESGAYSYEAGYIYYAIDGEDNDTQELYLSLTYDTLLSPTVTLYYDIDAGDGAFLTASASHSIPLNVGNNLELEFGASISANIDNDVMSIDTNGDGKVDSFTDLYNGEVSASVSIPLNNGITITPKAAYTTALSNDAEDAIKGLGVSSSDRVSSIFYAGVGASINF